MSAKVRVGSSAKDKRALTKRSIHITWPTIPRRQQHDDELTLHSLVPGQILTISKLWSRKTCKEFVQFLSKLPLVTTPATRKADEAVRVNDRFQIDDAAFAQAIWDSGLNEVLTNGVIDGKPLDTDARKLLWGGELLGLNQNIRIYRYRKGQFFAAHYDESNVIDIHVSPSRSVHAYTTWTLLIYLTAADTGCVGGETVFYPEAPSKKTATPAPIIANLEVVKSLTERNGW